MKNLKIIVFTAILALCLAFVLPHTIRADEYDGTTDYDTWLESLKDKYSGGDGTKENPWQISTAEDLLFLRTDSERDGSFGGKLHYFVITNDIVLNDDYQNYKTWKSNAPKVKMTDTIDSHGYPMGLYYANIDGQGHTIYGLYGDGYSLFNTVYDSAIKNLNFSHFYMKNAAVLGMSVGKAADSINENSGYENISLKNGIVTAKNAKLNKDVKGYFGALTCQQNDVPLKNISVDIDMTTDRIEFVGMITGSGKGLVDCTTAGKLTVNIAKDTTQQYYSAYVGGMAGICDGGKWENCTNKADITVNLPADKAVTTELGGIIGGMFNNASGSLISCTNTGKLTVNTKYDLATAKKQKATRQNSYVAGIAASLGKGSIKDCVNKGKISSSFGQYAAGIVAQSINDASISNCLNTASIKTTACTATAGIAAKVTGNITHCENRGELISTEKMVDKKTFFVGGSIAGIVATFEAGKKDCAVTYCKNTGHIQAKDTALWLESGGIVGNMGTAYECKGKATLSNCVNTSLVEGCMVAGIVVNSSGKSASKKAIIKNCVNTGLLRHNYEDDRIAGISFWLNDTKLTNCYNLGKIEKPVYNRYGDNRTGMIVSVSNKGGRVDNVYTLDAATSKWPVVAINQNGGSTGKVTRLSLSKLKKNATVKKIIKNAGLN